MPEPESGDLPLTSRDRPSQRRPGESAPGGTSGSDERAQSAPKPPSFRDRLRDHWILAAAAACVLLVALIGGILYWLEVRHYESTDDAFIAARSFSVAPKVSGYVTAVPVTDNQHVAAGDLLARIDDRDYRIAADQAEAQVAVAGANIANIQAQIDSQREQINQAKAQEQQAEAQLQFAQQEAARAQDLVEKGAGTVQRQQQTRSDPRRSKPTPTVPRRWSSPPNSASRRFRRSLKARAARCSRRRRSSIRPDSISAIPMSPPRNPGASSSLAPPWARLRRQARA
jgi:multidrug resistance efflux pump